MLVAPAMGVCDAAIDCVVMLAKQRDEPAIVDGVLYMVGRQRAAMVAQRAAAASIN